MAATMELENSIALGYSCDDDQAKLVNNLPLLSPDVVAKFVAIDYGLGSSNISTAQAATLARDDSTYLDVAHSIISNRYTHYGWRDYMYCYMNVAATNVDLVLATICILSRSSSLSTLLYIFKLFYSPTLVMVADADDRYSWRYFNGSVWMCIDKMQLRGMFYARCERSGIGQLLGLTGTELQRGLDVLNRMLLRGDSGFHLFAPNFHDDADNKETTFCMRGCTYDIARSVIRRQLPGDLCTLAGGVDPNAADHMMHRQEMMDILAAWMDGADVADSYLDILAAAIGEFGPRYAVINSGTGADGKSTFFHIIAGLWGSYCMTMPGSGPTVDTRNTNDATPVASAMVGRRIFITTDATNVGKMLTSSGFKAVSGGDTTYIRKLYKEATTKSPRLKGLVLINTNYDNFVATSISDLTRIRVVRWLHKRITVEDRDIVPRHQVTNAGNVVQRFEQVFLQRLGSCMMMELILRHRSLKVRDMRIDTCLKIRQWTRDVVAPKTVQKFVQVCCTYAPPNATNSADGAKDSAGDSAANVADDEVCVDDATAYALSTQTMQQVDQQEASVQDLFVAYSTWRKHQGGKLSANDPTTMDAFTAHLEFYYPLSKRISAEGSDEAYVEGLSLRPEMDSLTMLLGGRQITHNLLGASPMFPQLPSGGGLGSALGAAQQLNMRAITYGAK